jgi:hypothetical protein
LDDKIINVLIEIEEKRFNAHQLKKYVADKRENSSSLSLKDKSSFRIKEPTINLVTKTYLTAIIKDGYTRIKKFSEAKTK